MAHKGNTTPGDKTTTRDETRQKLIQAGIEVFGRCGYEAATTRMLAGAANVNLAAIPYHFGGKEGLYLGVIQHLAGKIAERLDGERRKTLSILEKKRATRQELLTALEGLVRAVGRLMISAEFGGQFGPIIIREHLHPSNAFDYLFKLHMEPVHRAITMIVARIERIDPKSPEAIIRAHTILGQIVSFRVMREAILRRLECKDLEGARTEEICDIIVENCRRILRGGRGA